MPKRLKHLAATILLTLLGIYNMDAQCNVTAVVEGNNVIFSVTNPTPGVTYTWTADFTLPNNPPFSGNGTSFTVPIQQPLPNVFNIRLVGSDNPNQPCWQVNTVSIQNACFETAGYTFQTNGCTVKFTPAGLNLANVVSFNWNFGDGSPVSHEACPSHDYPAPGGTFQASLATILRFTTNWQIFICTQSVTTVCGIDCGTPPDLGFQSMEFFDCCQLRVSFNANCDFCQHTWQFGNCGTSTEANPVFTVQNLSTYADGTPTIQVTHTITCQGQQPATQTFTYTFQNQGIFAGTPGDPTATFSLQGAVSCQNGALLFPGASLPSPVTRNVHFYSTPIVDKTYTFGSENICMESCAGINIGSPRTLTINSGTVIQNGPGCTIWRGVEINGTNARVVVTGASIIRDAMVAVRAMSASSRVQLTGGIFRNNFVGFAAETNFVNLSFNGNTFEGDGIGTMDPVCGAPPAYIGQAYSTAQPFAGVFVANSTLNIPIGPVNTFNRMANGIWMRNSNSTALRNCNFNFMAEDGFVDNGGRGIMFLDGTGNHQCVQTGGLFNTCLTGIFVNVFGPNSRFRSLNATMNPVVEGYRFVVSGSIVPFAANNRSRVIGANVTSTRFGLGYTAALGGGGAGGNASQLDVHSNTFNATTGNGVQLIGFVPQAGGPTLQPQDINIGGAGGLLNTITINSNNADPSRGVWVLNFRGGRVDNNNITIGGAGSFARGLNLEGGGGTTVQFNNVTGNFVPGQVGNTNFTDGILTDNSAGNIYFNNAFANTFNGMRFNGACPMQNNIDCNSMTNHSTGMFYMDGATITNPQNCGLNTWNANSGGAFFNGGLTQALASLYTTLQTSPQRPNPINLPGWFINGNCTGTCPPNFAASTPGISAADNMIATTGIVTGDAFQTGTNWLHQRSLYRRLVADPGLLAGQANMQAFKAASDGQPLGQLVNVEAQLHTAFQLSPSKEAELNTLSGEIAVLLSDIEALDILLADPNLTEAQVDAYAAQRDAKTALLDAKYAATTAIYDQWMAERIGASAGIVAANNAITTVGDHDGNEKTLNGIYAAKALKGLPLTWQERDQILAITKQCPKKGGAAVYWARAWYAALTGVSVQEEDCVIQRSSEGVGNQLAANTLEFKLYPNPASSAFTLVGPSMPAGETWIIQLYAGTGQLMGDFAYVPDGRTEIPLKDFPSGIYWCKVLNGKQQIVTQKISVIK